MPYVFEPAFTNSDEFFYWLNDFADDWRYMCETPIDKLAKDSESTLAAFVSGCDAMIVAAKDFSYGELVDSLQSLKKSGRLLLSVTTQEKASSQRELSNLFTQLKENIAICKAKPSIVLATCPATPQSDVHANGPATAQPDAQGDGTMQRLLSVFTNGVSDDRIKQSDEVLKNNSLSANDKLLAIDKLTPFPPTASAQQLAVLLKVSKQAVLKSEWWKDNRSGQREEKIEARKANHKERSKVIDDSHFQDDE